MADDRPQITSVVNEAVNQARTNIYVGFKHGAIKNAAAIESYKYDLIVALTQAINDIKVELP